MMYALYPIPSPSLYSCRNLMYLNLSYCENISDTGIELLTQLSNLLDLDITGCNLSDQVQTRYKEYSLRLVTYYSMIGSNSSWSEQKVDASWFG